MIYLLFMKVAATVAGTLINKGFTQFVSNGMTIVPATVKSDERDSRPLDQDVRWALARRITGSSTFARSEQLPKLLLYICRMTISDRANEINEQRIGIDVYGRSPNYDPATDGIVRSHATRLRQRLELYFSSEGAYELFRIEIPRGGYVPRFYTLESTPPVSSSVPIQTGMVADAPASGPGPLPSPVPEVSRQRPPRHNWIGPFLTGLAIAGALIGITLHLRHDAALAAGKPGINQTEIERRFWTGLSSADRRTLIVSGDSGLVLFETVTGEDVSLLDYINGSYRNPDHIKLATSTASKQLTADLASRRYTSFVDLDLSSQLSQLLGSNSEHLTTVFARDLRPSDAARSNLILIGSRQANPWVSLVEPSMNFILTRSDDGSFYFLNRHPLDDELKAYHPLPELGNLGAIDVYGDVAYLPNPAGNGMVLVFSGLWMSGTQSAGEFVLDSTRFSAWLKQIVAPDGTIPPFELLIRTKSLQGSAASSLIVAKRVLNH